MKIKNLFKIFSLTILILNSNLLSKSFGEKINDITSNYINQIDINKTSTQNIEILNNGLENLYQLLNNTNLKNPRSIDFSYMILDKIKIKIELIKTQEKIIDENFLQKINDFILKIENLKNLNLRLNLNFGNFFDYSENFINNLIREIRTLNDDIANLIQITQEHNLEELKKLLIQEQMRLITLQTGMRLQEAMQNIIRGLTQQPR